MGKKRKATLQKAEKIKESIWLIENDDLRAFTYFILSHAHPEFWTAPPSSTGKYHPKFENGEEGLIKHIIATLTFALEGLRRYGYSVDYKKDPNEIAKMRDMVVFVALIHDFAKNGPPDKWLKHTVKFHGENCASLIKEQYLPKFIKLFPEINDVKELIDMVEQCCQSIARHYGIWCKEKLPANSEKLSDLDKIIQEADYYSSRRIIKDLDWEEVKKVQAEHSPAYVKKLN